MTELGSAVRHLQWQDAPEMTYLVAWPEEGSLSFDEQDVRCLPLLCHALAQKMADLGAVVNTLVNSFLELMAQLIEQLFACILAQQAQEGSYPEQEAVIHIQRQGETLTAHWQGAVADVQGELWLSTQDGLDGQLTLSATLHNQQFTLHCRDGHIDLQSHAAEQFTLQSALTVTRQDELTPVFDGYVSFTQQYHIHTVHAYTGQMHTCGWRGIWNTSGVDFFAQVQAQRLPSDTFDPTYCNSIYNPLDAQISYLVSPDCDAENPRCWQALLQLQGVSSETENGDATAIFVDGLDCYLTQPSQEYALHLRASHFDEQAVPSMQATVESSAALPWVD